MHGARELARDTVGWSVLRQGLPVALGMAAHALFNLVDLAMVGQLGEDAVAAVHVATTIGFLPMVLGNAVSVATMSMMSRALGAGRVADAARLSSWSQLAMLLFGIVLGVAGALVAEPCVRVQGVVGDAHRLGTEYLVVSHLGTFTMFALMQSTATMRALGQSAMPAILLVGANALNIGLNVVLIFGWERVGIAPFGAVGAAYATVFARGVAAVVGVWWIARPHGPLRFRWPGFAPPARALAEVLALGLPGTAQMLLRALAVIVLTRMTADFGGKAAVVALSVMTRLDTVTLFLAVGYAGAATTIVGHAVGAGDAARARIATRHAGLHALGLGVVVIACFFVFADELMRLFVRDASPQVVALGSLYLGSAALAQPLAGLCLVITGGLHGAGQTVRPLLIDLCGYAVGAGVAAVLAYGVELPTLWWSFVALNGGLAIAHFAYAELGSWPTSCHPDSSPGARG